MTYLEKLKKLNARRPESKNATRICSEITYLDAISKHRDNALNAQIEAAVDFILGECEKDGVITSATVKAAEDMLMDLQPIARSYKEKFIGHAHIDMNWMWGYNETSTITCDTFRTVLDLMKEYPEFTFGQSQASTYEIAAEYAPELIDEIKERIAEGRWEVTATEWVEPDKNLPNGESLVRQILQARKYLSSLLGIKPESLDMDFVPDTFGHNINVPEILANSGVKYMYHWRGDENAPRVYRYVSPSGKKVLCYREFVCYLGTIEPVKFEIVPEFTAQTGLDTYLCVYGVGDHGGGPTRRDIERILEYKSWPLTPTISFGTYRDFFRYIEESEKNGVKIPDVTDEQNFLFTGCYTSQNRIKMANRFSEARINETEALAATASLIAGAKREPEHLDRPWRNILFNHFHDILPGSGVRETREFALGRFQETLANVSTYATSSMRKIAANIDTTSIEYDDSPETFSEGGGVGFNGASIDRYRMPSTERGRGNTRVIHIFNPTGYVRDEFTMIQVWDYTYELGMAQIVDANGEPIEYTILETGHGYWWHSFTKFLVKVKIPAYGYTTVILKPKANDGHLNLDPGVYTRSNEILEDFPIVLENDCIKATFDCVTMELVELYDKKTGETLISEPSCYFRLIKESTKRGMTSWKIGPYCSITNLNRECGARLVEESHGDIYSKFKYEIKFGRSWLNCVVSLKKGSPVLEFENIINWKEEGSDGTIPQLNFAVPVSYRRTGEFHCDIPFGYIVRKNQNSDVPALSYIGLCGQTEHKIGIMCDSKYGYRVTDEMAALTLMHTATDPDPCSDSGEQFLTIGIAAAGLSEMKEISDKFNHPMPFIASIRHEGKLPLEGAPVAINGDVKVSVMKVSEDGEGTAIRVYDDDGREKTVTLAVSGGIKEAYYADSGENKLADIAIADGKATFKVPAYDFVTVVVK